jgi:hypothetical protein
MKEERKVEADIRKIAEELGLDLEKMLTEVFGDEPACDRQLSLA